MPQEKHHWIVVKHICQILYLGPLLQCTVNYSIKGTPHARKFFVVSPFIQYIFFSVGLDNSGTYMFLIDIPFKVCQGRSNHSSIVHAV
jgi:hypothetical protein